MSRVTERRQENGGEKENRSNIIEWLIRLNEPNGVILLCLMTLRTCTQATQGVQVEIPFAI